MVRPDVMSETTQFFGFGSVSTFLILVFSERKKKIRRRNFKDYRKKKLFRTLSILSLLMEIKTCLHCTRFALF